MFRNLNAVRYSVNVILDQVLGSLLVSVSFFRQLLAVMLFIVMMFMCLYE